MKIKFKTWKDIFDYFLIIGIPFISSIFVVVYLSEIYTPITEKIIGFLIVYTFLQIYTIRFCVEEW